MVVRSSWNSFVETNWKSGAALAHGIGRNLCFFLFSKEAIFFLIVERKDATLSGVVDTKFNVYSI